MFQIIQEAALPKLSSTSLYNKFNSVSNINSSIASELKNMKDYTIMPKDIEDIIALMRLNGDAIVKKAINAYIKGQIIIIFNKNLSSIPTVLPYLIIKDKQNKQSAVIFAHKVVDNINSSNEYRNLMSVLEAAYLALALAEKPNTFINNRSLMLTLCNAYKYMVIAPLEQKMYMKGENLVKAMMYTISYFYKMIDGEIKYERVPFNRMISDKIDPSVGKQIVNDVNNMQDMSIMSLLDLIIKINPVRYKDIKKLYVNYFISICGSSIVFALENISYLLLLVISSNYKSNVTGYGINKIITVTAKKTVQLLMTLNI